MFDVIERLHRILCAVKDFSAGYRGSDAWYGYMMMEYKDKKYAVKIVEMDELDQIAYGFDVMDHVPKYFK